MGALNGSTGKPEEGYNLNRGRSESIREAIHSDIAGISLRDNHHLYIQLPSTLPR